MRIGRARAQYRVGQCRVRRYPPKNAATASTTSSRCASDVDGGFGLHATVEDIEHGPTHGVVDVTVLLENAKLGSLAGALCAP
jgi:hypothetical protein